MAYIKSRKRPAARLNASSAAVALAFAALPGAVYAQQAGNTAKTTTETLPQITVQGQGESYKADTVSSPKFTQPLLNTTQTISVIKSELVQQQGGTTLTEALRNSPGVGTFSLGENGNTNTGDTIYMRGFDTSSAIFVDGVRDLGAISRDMFNIQQVEVTKGPAGTDNGRSAPTGSINLVTKQPTLKEAYSGSIGVGSGDYKRATADLNKPLNLESGAALRVNLLKDDSGVAGRDEVKTDREGVAAALAFGLKTNSRTYLNYLHVNQHGTPDGGVPTIGLPGYFASDSKVSAAQNAVLNASPKVDSSNFYGSTQDYNDVKADMFTARIEHDFSSDLKLQNTTRYGKTTQNLLTTSFMAIAGATTDALQLSRTSNYRDQENQIFSNQTNLVANFTTGNIKHSLVTGLELTREKQTSLGLDGLGTYAPSSLYNPDPDIGRNGYAPFHDGADSHGRTDTASVYLFDTLELNPTWQINGGLRVDQYDTDYESAVMGTGVLGAGCTSRCNGYPKGQLSQVPDASKSGTLLNWKLGVLYKPTENSSLYANYATAKQPPGGANFSISATGGNNAQAFDPQSTRTAEVGGKWNVLDGKLALTGAIYRTTISNEVENDPVDTTVYTQTGKKRVQGIEIGAVGNVTSAWAVSTGYTVMDTEIVEGAINTADGSSALPYTPKHAFTAWTTYKLPGGFTIGGGARYVGALHKQKDGAVNVPKEVDSYWVYDAMASYTISKNAELQLNLYNLTDKDYVASINKSGYRYFPGVERSARLTLNVKF
jgi:catecholate siderophore receptor